MRIVVINHLTLDGVMQAPGRADEDTRDEFQHGGRSPPYGDEVMGEAMRQRLAASGGLLLGRRTYEELLAYWNTQDSPFRDALNNAPKYVASTTLTDPLPWPNSTLLGGDLFAEVGELKARPGGDLHILGSGQLIDALMRYHLVDEFLLTIHPLVLGRGRRLFTDDGTHTTLELVGAEPTTTGVIIATYRTASQPS